MRRARTQYFALTAGFCALMALGTGVLCAGVAKKVLPAPVGKNLLKRDGWTSIAEASREGDLFVCDNSINVGQRSFRQIVELNQKTPQPIVATVESLAENVIGARDSEYALHLDITYTDGTVYWSQAYRFSPIADNWQRGRVRIFPEKPIQHVAYYLLFRGRHGKATFRKPTLSVIPSADANFTWFDGLAVHNERKPGKGFLIRDVKAGSNFVTFERGCALGLTLASETKDGHTVAKLTDTTGKDRAVTLIYTLPMDGRGWQWLGGLCPAVTAESSREYLIASTSQAGNGLLSRWPLAAVAKGGDGKAISLDMARPAFYRVGFSAAGELYIAFDLALTKEKPSATVAFEIFDFSGRQGFRGALATLYARHPADFASRTKKTGLWIPFHNIREIHGWKHFGFRFKEGMDEIAWDERHDILTFRYTEPLAWWMPMGRGIKRNLPVAQYEAKLLADDEGNKLAQALFVCGFYDEKGRLTANFRNESWSSGAIWTVNSSPSCPGETTFFNVSWNRYIHLWRYGKHGKKPLDGEYIDSIEGAPATVELNFRREHFATAETPLTFATDTLLPAMHRGLIAFAYTRGLSRDIRSMKRFVMGNGTPDRLCWLAPQLDVLGAETNWLYDRWLPMSEPEMFYRRALAGKKPFCFIMNTDFSRFTPAMVEKYMVRSLSWGMLPGFFRDSVTGRDYFAQARLYNRDRDMFRKYIPLCQRLAEAGWQPVPTAACDVEDVRIERFGEGKKNYLTVFNDGNKSASVIVSLNGLPAKACRELVKGSNLSVRGGKVELQLAPDAVAVLELQP